MLGAASLIAVAGLGVWLLPGAAERSRQRRTAVALRSLGLAIGTYEVDHHVFPDARSIEELLAILGSDVAPYLKGEDGWGRPLRYQRPRGTGLGCAVASAGRDGTFEHEDLMAYDPSETIGFDSDIVYRFGPTGTSGEFVRLPSGIQRERTGLPPAPPKR